MSGLPFSILSRRSVLVAGGVAMLLVALSVLQPWQADAQPTRKRQSFVQGPIGIAQGQATRINVFIPRGVGAETAFDLDTGRTIALQRMDQTTPLLY